MNLFSRYLVRPYSFGLCRSLCADDMPLPPLCSYTNLRLWAAWHCPETKDLLSASLNEVTKFFCAFFLQRESWEIFKSLSKILNHELFLARPLVMSSVPSLVHATLCSCSNCSHARILQPKHSQTHKSTIEGRDIDSTQYFPFYVMRLSVYVPSISHS